MQINKKSHKCIHKIKLDSEIVREVYPRQYMCAMDSPALQTQCPTCMYSEIC